MHALVDTMSDTPVILESIAIDQTQNERVRHSAVLLAVSAAQSISSERAMDVLERIAASVQDDDELAAVVSWLRCDVQQFGFVSLY